jgi:hypothetical protein
MFGLTNETARWLLLSDGGHFDNLGLYEMVRRHCRIIVVVDGGADADYNFSDLGHALARIQTDLGIRIDFTGIDRLKRRFTTRPTPAEASPSWAVGRIRYAASNPTFKDGVLLYLKAGLHGAEPVNILSYGLTHAQFPHDSTVNQFYGESQFESYRALGYEVVNDALVAAGLVKAGSNSPTNIGTLKLREVIERLAQGAPSLAQP